MIKHPVWTDEEIKILKDNYSKSTKEEICKLLPNRKYGNIKTKASKLGIKKDYYYWTEHEIDILKRFYSSDCTIDEIVHKLGDKYSYGAVQNKANKLGLRRREFWSEEEDKILIDNYEVKLLDDVMKLLPNRSRHGIIERVIKLGLHSPIFWRDEEIDYLIANWKIKSDYEMAKELNKSQLCIKTKRNNMGLFRVDRSGKNYETLSKFIRSNNSQWKLESIENCEYKCILTDSKSFDVHHLVNVSTMVKTALENLNIEYKVFDKYTDEELKMILVEFLRIQSEHPLGVCLDKNIHVLYHSLYGQQNNNVEQFNHFVSEFKNGIFDDLLKQKCMWNA